jgi:hypothetical protein
LEIIKQCEKQLIGIILKRQKFMVLLMMNHYFCVGL